ncbi:ferredoxin [Saccharomonospora sp. NPDC006951]
MRINVDMALCQNYGQCVFAAPEHFDLDDAGDLVHQASADESARADIEAAAMACPVQAITIEG